MSGPLPVAEAFIVIVAVRAAPGLNVTSPLTKSGHAPFGVGMSVGLLVLLPPASSPPPVNASDPSSVQDANANKRSDEPATKRNVIRRPPNDARESARGPPFSTIVL